MAGVMKQLTQTIENKFYTFVPGEFLPIFEGGQLMNRNEFYKYKAKRMLTHIGRKAYHAAEALDHLVQASHNR